MQQTMICKSCGFILTGDKIPDACPACGVPARMFIPHDERISPSRKRMLALDLHPVIVHFTQAYTATILVLAWLALGLQGVGAARVSSVLVVLAYALPVTVMAAFAAGMLDGRIRFRKVTTPLLVRKMVLGTVLFLLTCGILACVVRDPNLSHVTLLVMGILSLPAMACASILGFWGVSLLNCRFPG